MSLPFVSAAGFLGLHALATPGVLIGKNAGGESGHRKHGVAGTP